jgi:hypothetical protein
VKGTTVTTTPGTSNQSDATAISDHEAEQIAQANASGHTPVVFVHGLWLLASSWDRC